MNCIVTAGPTYEPLDQVRRLTNRSTGRLGCELAGHLTGLGHQVTLLIGEQASWAGERRAERVEVFTTADDLQERLRQCAAQPVNAVFHAAAVGDFCFGKVWSRSAAGDLTEVRAGKIPTGPSRLLAELIPTSKIISRLRLWFPGAQLVGWKYEVDGNRETALARARQQIEENRTHACVVNGPAYGVGFGVIGRDGAVVHLEDRPALCAELSRRLAEQKV
jgi:phosphopantothenoylcysteine decarboxylase/phosphopantothenate--cysteine ligase